MSRSRRLGLSPDSIRQRLREWQFWLVQVGVAVAALLHGTLEVVAHNGELPQWAAGMSHVPVDAYLIPVVYAGLRYGIDGGVVTGLSVALLSTPNLTFFHRDGFEWLGEGVSISFVVAVGIVVSLVVEREMQARAAVEAANRLLTLLNEVGANLTRSTDPQHLLDTTLAAVVGFAEFDAAQFVPRDDQDFLLPVTHRNDISSGRSDWPGVTATDEEFIIGAPVSSEANVFGALRIVPAGGARPTRRDEELVTAIGRELGIALENGRLRDLERNNMKSYIREATRAQEEERRRIARDLHDGVAQSLVVILRGLTGLSDRAQLPVGTADRVADLQRTTAGALESIRRVSHALRPALLDDLGLTPAIEWLVSQLAHRSEQDVSCTIDGKIRRVSSEVELAMFRIAQEALSNIERHADADRATVALAFADYSVSLTVSDDGIGFDNDRLANAPTLGLTGMRERADLVGGRLEIQTALGEGTIVSFDVEA